MATATVSPSPRGRGQGGVLAKYTIAGEGQW
jgi:hypothetical protein